MRFRQIARNVAASLLVMVVWGASGCDGCHREIEPYVPGEQPEQPDLSQIFPPGAERAAEHDAEQARQMPGAPARGSGPRGAPPVGAVAEPIRGTVALGAGLADRVPPDAVLFLIVRPGGGGGTLAAQRIASPQFPLEFTIGPDDWMGRPAPADGSLQLSARIDGDGDAMTRVPGDLRGDAEGTYRPGASGISLVIDEVL